MTWQENGSGGHSHRHSKYLSCDWDNMVTQLKYVFRVPNG